MVKSYTIGYTNWQFMSGLQQNLLDNGHKLNVYLHNLPDNLLTMKEERLGKNSKNVKFFNKNTKEEFIKSCDFIVSDNPYCPIHDGLIEKHPYIVCPTPQFSILEDDRELGKRLAKLCGLSIPPSGHTFYIKQDSIDFLKNSKDGKYVLKGHNHTFIAPSREDAINFIEQDIYGWFNKTKPYLYIEGFVEGYEVAFGCFFNGEEILDLSLVTCEYKGAQNEDRSFVLTGEVGTSLLWRHFTDYPRAVQTTLKMAARIAKSNGYKGFIDINTIITPEKNNKYTINFLEFTTRPGIPTEFEICSFWGKDYANWLAYLSGYNKNFDVPKQCYTKVGIAGALFSQGLGLSEREPKYKPLITGIKDAKKYCDVILQDSYEFKSANHKEVQYCVSNWDRALYCVKYTDEKQFLKHPGVFVSSVRYALKSLKCWGHTYRDDIGNNLEDTIYLLNKIKISEQKYSTVKGKFGFSYIKDFTDTKWMRLLDNIAFNNYELSWNSFSKLDKYVGLYCEDYKEFIGFITYKQLKNCIYLKNICRIPLDRYMNTGQILLTNWLEDNKNSKIKLECIPELVFYYKMFGFKEVKKVDNQVIMVKNPD